MAEEFQAGVCGSTWWNSPMSTLGLSPCSVAINNDHMGSFGWSNPDLVVDMNMKGRSSSTTTTTTTTDESGSVSHDGSMVMFQETQKPLHQQADSGGRVLMDSNLQMMGIGFSSFPSTTDWNQTLLSGGGGSGRSESNYQSSILAEDMNSRLNFRQEAGMEWSPMKNFSVVDGQESSVVNGSKLTNPGFPLSEPCLNPATNSMMTCQDLATSFPMSSASYGYPSTLLQTLFDTTDPQPQPSLFEDRSMNYPSTTNYKTNLNGFSPSMAQLSPLLRPKQQTIASLQLTNTSTPFWNNASTAALNDIQASFFPSTPTFEEKPNCPNFTAKRNNDAVKHLGSMVKKSSSEPAFKRPRIETPSPLPTFKVRKEKLGDRITALQQLVSPFGKTDTASVLQEAIEYIKFLHDQVSVLSTPYMKNGTPIQHQQTSDKLNDSEAIKQDLRSRGLCLVPISSTFPVANETTVDFWTPTFGGTFR